MTDLVLITYEDGEFGIVSAADAMWCAQEQANQERTTVHGRNPTTDEILFTVEPA